MCSAIISVIAFPSEREIRRHDMSWGGCADAYWDVASFILRSLEYLLCFVSVVCDAIRQVGVEVIGCLCGFDDLSRRHNLREIVNRYLD